MVLELTDQDIGRKIDFYVESMGRLDTLTRVFKNITFSSEHTPLLESFCKIVSSDIFISTGSSLALVLAFLPSSSPILFEENKKNILGRSRPVWNGGRHSPQWMGSTNEHLFTTSQDDAILLKNGAPVNSYYEMTRLLRSRLKTKLYTEPTATTTT